MSQFGEAYSGYYDLLYADKNYVEEVNYVDAMIKKQNPQAKTLLDMGCGTGRHAELFCDRGYRVHGVDLSQDMLKIAASRRVGKKENLSFSHSDIQELELGQKFDVVISLFHVMSYQNTNDELVRAFDVAKAHLEENGVFIFDFWYGPAVLTNLPSIRIKRFENEELEATRIAEPVIYAIKNRVDVHYDIFIKNKKSNTIVEKKELHRMRYFFDTELEMICKISGLEILSRYMWLSDKEPGFDSWNAVWMVKN